MERKQHSLTRRSFLATAAALSVSTRPVRAATKHRRYNVTSAEGQKMLASYAQGVAAMLKLPPSHPQNWFRNAFVHLMDCPHGNWWFYVWHRGYIGYLEQTIRSLSGNPDFTIPYWDWTALPEMPGAMFDGVLSPTDEAYEPYTGNLARFTTTMRPALEAFWATMSKEQLAQLDQRGYHSVQDVWNDVTGATVLNKQTVGIAGNQAFANTCGARYLSRDNPKLDEKTAYNVSEFIIYSGLSPINFYDTIGALSFNSSKTASHHKAPSQATVFSTLEGLSHNKVHNYIGGVGPLDPGPYGFMTNFLSPVDPIFFLHHSNIDRLWDVWARKQKVIGRPILPTGEDWTLYSSEAFLFYVDGQGRPVGPKKAGDFVSTDVFDYDYQPGSGESIVNSSQPTPAGNAMAGAAAQPVKGSVKANTATIALPSPGENEADTSARQPLVASITLPHPDRSATTRQFDVFVDPTAGDAQGAKPQFAGTISFFGPMMAGMSMSNDATFTVPLPAAPSVANAPASSNGAPLAASSSGKRAAVTPNRPTVQIRVVPSQGQAGPAPVLTSVSISKS